MDEIVTQELALLNQFISCYPCSPAPLRPNTSPKFRLVDPSKPPLVHSSSPFKPHAWATLLSQYRDALPSQLVLILRFGASIGYDGPESTIISPNLRSALLEPGIIQKKLEQDLACGRVIPITQTSPLISSPLGLAPKANGDLRRIHHLSYPRGQSVNDFIPREAVRLKYATLANVLTRICRAGRGAVIIKKDIMDAFRNIPVAPHQRWLLCFQWEGVFYQETCLPFGLSTSPFLFNLFGEAFHWMLISYLNWTESEHYLDDFIHILEASAATPSDLEAHETGYQLLTDCLGIPRQEAKNHTGTVVPIFGIEVDTNTFTARIPKDKLKTAETATAKALSKESLTLHEIQSLTGFLSFCAQVVRLGWVFMRKLWDYVASFPVGSSQYTKRRIPPEVRSDLQWWNELLPKYNGISFFDTTARPTIQLYTDASLQGLGGIFYKDNTSFWSDIIPNIPQDQAFAVPISAPTHINIHELEAILLAFQEWGQSWSQSELVVYTDSTTAFDGFTRQTLRGKANKPLREILLLAAEHDINITPRWITSQQNGLADALSRFNVQTVANLCPHWQNPWNSMLLPRNF